MNRHNKPPKKTKRQRRRELQDCIDMLVSIGCSRQPCNGPLIEDPVACGNCQVIWRLREIRDEI